MLTKNYINFFLLACLSAPLAPATFEVGSAASSLTVGSGATLVVSQPITNFAGTVKKESGAVVSGSSISLSSGVYQDSGNAAQVSGTLDLAGAGQIVLDGSKSYKGVQGKTIKSLLVKGKSNRLEGEPLFENNIILQHSGAELTTALKGRLSSNIVLNNGTLVLEDDLYFADSFKITGSGKIRTNGRMIGFGVLPITLSDNVNFIEAGDVTLGGNTTLNSVWKFTGQNNVINGQGNILILGASGQIQVDQNDPTYGRGSLLIKNIIIQGVAGNNLRCLDSLGTMTLQQAVMNLSANYTFHLGSISYLDLAEWAGTYTFLYSSGLTSTIQKNSRLKFSEDITFSFGRKNGYSANDSLAFTDGTGRIELNNTTLYVTSSGSKFLNGQFVAKNKVTIDIASKHADFGFFLGDGTVANDPSFVFGAGCQLFVPRGHIILDITNPRALTTRSAISTLNNRGTVVLKKSVLVKGSTVDLRVAPNFVFSTGKYVFYEDALLLTALGEFSITGTQVNIGIHLLDTNGLIFISRGKLPTYIQIYGSGTQIKGPGDIGNTVQLLSSSAALTIDIAGELQSSLLLGGGSVTLGSDLRMTKLSKMTGKGSVTLNNNSLALYSKDENWTSTIKFVGSTGGIIDMRGGVSLSGTWTFNGTCRIRGNGNTIDMRNGGEIVVDNGSQLMLHNVKIKNLHSTRLRCMNKNSSIILDNADVVLDGNFTFSQGGLKIRNNFSLDGDYKFAYQSGMSSTIEKNSMLHLHSGITFSYDPIVRARADLVEFENASSHIYLHAAALHATMTGMQLKKGLLIAEGVSFVSSDARRTAGGVTDPGIIFGDETSSNDCICKILNSATLTVTRGSLTHKNVTSNTFVFDGLNAILRVAPLAYLRLHTSFNPSDGIVSLGTSAYLARKSGKTILGSVHVDGPTRFEDLA